MVSLGKLLNPSIFICTGQVIIRVKPLKIKSGVSNPNFLLDRSNGFGVIMSLGDVLGYKL